MINSTPSSSGLASNRKNGCSYFANSSRTRSMELIPLILFHDHFQNPADQSQSADNRHDRDAPLKETECDRKNLSPGEIVHLRSSYLRSSRGLRSGTPHTWAASPYIWRGHGE